jgi:uncharacterized protein
MSQEPITGIFFRHFFAGPVAKPWLLPGNGHSQTAPATIRPERMKALLLIMAVILAGCTNRYFYYPDRIVYQTPEAYGLAYESIYFNSQDHTRLHGWLLKAPRETAGTVIFFHGNARNMTANLPAIAWLPLRGFNVFAFDYRGYGASDGTPDRRGIFEDSVAAIEYVLAREDLGKNGLFVLAQSLGGAKAIAVLAHHGELAGAIDAIAVDSTFFSYRQIAADKMRAIPVLSILSLPLSLAVSDDLSPGPLVGRLSPMPLCLIHGTADAVVPYGHSVMLFEEAGAPKELWLVDKGDHVDALISAETGYRKKVVRFFRWARARKLARGAGELGGGISQERALLVR